MYKKFGKNYEDNDDDINYNDSYDVEKVDEDVMVIQNVGFNVVMGK